MADAMEKHSSADVLVSFASLRSAYDSTVETMGYPQVRKISEESKMLRGVILLLICEFPWV